MLLHLLNYSVIWYFRHLFNSTSSKRGLSVLQIYPKTPPDIANIILDREGDS